MKASYVGKDESYTLLLLVALERIVVVCDNVEVSV